MKRFFLVLLWILSIYTLVGCVSKEEDKKPVENKYDLLSKEFVNNRVYYELFVRSSFDSNNDGIGDFKGIEENISYFTDLGIQGIWMMPVNTTNSYHGYDIVDYMDVNEEYGTMEEFKSMVKTFKEHNILVMMDLVINHTSDQHPWFLKSKSGDSNYRDYYIWKGNNPYSSFVGGMVDLNLGNQDVFNEIVNIGKFYIDMGIGGFRLDAAKHFFQAEENNLNPGAAMAKSYGFIRDFKLKLREYDPNFFIVSEVLDSNIVSTEFYKGSDSVFNFDVKDVLVNATNGAGSSMYTTRIMNSYNGIKKYVPDFIDSPFLSNHDIDRIGTKVTLNDEFRDEKLKLSAELLLCLPGNPYIYYGDELGQLGYRVEGTNYPGYGIAYDELRRLPLKLGNDYETKWFQPNIDKDIVNYETQKLDNNSLYNHYKNMISVRKENIALQYGNDVQETNVNINGISSFIRTFSYNEYSQNLLIIHNISSNNIDISNLNLDKLVYSSNDSSNLLANRYSTVIFEITDNQLTELTN